MAMTKTTTITWTSAEAQDDERLKTARLAKLVEMLNDEKTDNVRVIIDPVTTIRSWRDQSAAEEYISFIMGQCEIFDLGIVSTVIGNVTPV
jgi:hypothetical protein